MKYTIYKIRNVLNNKCYVGSTCNFKKRVNQHLHNLRQNKHHSIKLQNAWNKYGESSFVFEIIENEKIDNIDDQYKTEQYYIESLNTYNAGYNMSESSYSPGSSIVWTNQMRKNMGEKISRTHKGKMPKNISLLHEKQRRPIFEYENNVLIRPYDSAFEAGIFLKIDYKIINNVLTGKTKNCRMYPNKTWVYQSGSKRIIKTNLKSASKKGKYKKVECLNDNRIFENAKDAAIMYNITEESVKRSCRGTTKNPKIKFKYI